MSSGGRPVRVSGTESATALMLLGERPPRGIEAPCKVFTLPDA